MKVEFIDQSIEVMTPKSVYSRFKLDLEKIARVCYKSEDKIKEGSAEELLNKIMKHGHGSVLEHTMLTIKFTTDRGMSHALVRHRHCAFMQESTHFIDYHNKGVLQIVNQAGLENKQDAYIWEMFMETMAKTYDDMPNTPSAVQRSIFPTAIKTELIISAGLLEWQHIMRVRSQPKCHPQMRQLANLVIHWFKKELPFFVTKIETVEEMDKRIAEAEDAVR